MEKLKVIDFFCGAGGFSEGFRQQGFDIIHGVDNWKPAIDTFNHNFGLSCIPQNIMDFRDNIDAINALPNTEIILGSPPCVSFSSSNRCGNANKTLGISLIEIFLRIIAVKKHQPHTQLKGWFMENVANSEKYMRPHYSFADLQLSQWAKGHGKSPTDMAIDFENNHQIVNSADYGVAQIRKRLFAGEVIGKRCFASIAQNISSKNQVPLKDIFQEFPKPLRQLHRAATITDPNYKNLALKQRELTDYAYDAGIYEMLWRGSEYLKINHPYMGKMSFPENFGKPSRTVTSTKITNSREALIYKDESKRNGDGEYRTPTVREIAILMSFPISYQFAGSENTKWKLIGNAVCPLVSSAIARKTLKILRRKLPKVPIVQMQSNLIGINNLNNAKIISFDNPPIRNKNSRFRRHPFKVGNMTVALSNYDLETNGLADGKWRTTVTYGTGQGFKLQEIKWKKRQENIHAFIQDTFEDGKEFLEEVHNGFTGKIAHASELQILYEKNISSEKPNPVILIEQVADMVSQYANGEIVDAGKIFFYKQKVHKRQLYALYALNHIRLTAHNSKRGS